MAQQVKNPPAKQATEIPGSGRSPGGGRGNPLKYSCQENAMDRRAWRATVHGVAKSQDTTEATEHTDTSHRLLALPPRVSDSGGLE